MDRSWEDAWLRYRQETPGVQHVAHFNNAGAALMPRAVIESMTAHIELEAQIGGYEAARLKADAIAEIYRDVGALVGAQPQNVALTASATDSYSRALSSVPFERGDVIVGAWNEYASNQIQFLSLAKRLGVEVLRAPSRPGGGTDIDALEHLVETRKPKLVAAVHVNTCSGFIEDVRSIGAVCRRHDVLYLLDGCQSFGQMPIDVDEVGCDFFSATSRKFLRGPRGAGMLFVSDRVLDSGLEPLFLDLRGAKLLEERRYEIEQGARRFEDWEFSYAVILGFGAAAKYALDIGLERIQRRLGELNTLVRTEIARSVRWQTTDFSEPSCPIVPVVAEGVDGVAVQRSLAERGINVSVIPGDWAPMDEGLAKAGWAIRISPHYYNSLPEIDRLLNALEEAADC